MECSIEFLVSYQNENVVLRTNRHDSIENVIRQRFSLPLNCKVKLQVYDKHWEEWINREPWEVKNKDKLKVITEHHHPTLLSPLKDNCASSPSTSSSSKQVPIVEDFFLSDGEVLDDDISEISPEEGLSSETTSSLDLSTTMGTAMPFAQDCTLNVLVASKPSPTQSDSYAHSSSLHQSTPACSYQSQTTLKDVANRFDIYILQYQHTSAKQKTLLLVL